MRFRFVAILLLSAAALLSGIAAGQQPHPAKIPIAACSPLIGQILKCPKFGFTYTVPFGWVDRTSEMVEPQTGNSSEPPSTSETLLAVFERPPDAPGETINSAVVIAAESLKDYRGVKTAADYFGPVTELAQQRGFQIVNEPYEFAVGTKKLVRADYSKPRGSLTMFQSTLAMIEKGAIISFTVVGGGEDEVDELLEKLKFAAPPAYK